MRAYGQVGLVMGMLVVGVLVVTACGSRGQLATLVAAAASTTPSPPALGAAVPATPSPSLPSSPAATAGPGQVPPLTAAATATAKPGPQSSPAAAATATASPGPLPSPTLSAQQQLALTSIHMITPSQGWATGLATFGSASNLFIPAVGDLFQTDSGGTTWQNVSPQGVSPRSIASAFFLDESNAWVAASTPVTTTGGAVSTTITTYGTIDGGQSWQRGTPFTVSGGGPASLDFIDAQHGWMMVGLDAAAGSEAVEILRTVDGGLHWQPVSLTLGLANQSTANSLPYGCDKNGITFVDVSTGWTAGTCPGGELFLYVTHDGGQTWQPQAPPPPPGDPADLFSNCQCAVNPPLFFSAQGGVLAITISEVNQGTYLYVTGDGGATWVLRELPVTQLRGAPDFFDANDGVITDGQQLFVTSDGGQTWTQLGTLPISETNLVGDIDFVDANDGWLTDGQHLYATHDGSQTWITITPVVVASLLGPPPPTDVTLTDDGQTLTLAVSERFLLDLGSEYTWTVTIDNPTIVTPVVNERVPEGAQGIYEALRDGTVNLTATGMPVCRQAQPPCATPSRQFQLKIVVQ